MFAKLTDSALFEVTSVKFQKPVVLRFTAVKSTINYRIVSSNFLAVNKHCQNIVFWLKNMRSKNAKFGAENLILGKFRGKIKILRIHNLICRKVASSYPPISFGLVTFNHATFNHATFDHRPVIDCAFSNMPIEADDDMDVVDIAA